MRSPNRPHQTWREFESLPKWAVFFVLTGFAWTLTSPSSLNAAVRTWDGGGPTNNASDANNWSSNTVPVSSDSVVFDATNSTKTCTWNISALTIATFTVNVAYSSAIVVTTNFTINKLIINGGKFDINASTVSVNLDVDVSSGSLRLLSSGSLMFNQANQLNLNGGTFQTTTGTNTIGGITNIDWRMMVNGGSLVVPSITLKNLDRLYLSSAVVFNQFNNVNITNFGSFSGSAYPAVEFNVSNSSFALTLNNWNFSGNISTNAYAVNVVAGASITFANATGSKAGSAFEKDPNNTVFWVPDPSTAAASTPLHPGVTAVSSNSVSTSWDTIGTAHYDAQISSFSNFSSIVQSTFNLASNAWTFPGLLPDTSYYIHVKLATESASAYTPNVVSTKTLSAGTTVATLLNPSFISVFSSSLTAAWLNLNTTYYAELSRFSNFSAFDFNGNVSTNTLTVTALLSNTTYYFRVRVATEPTSAFTPNTISTKTTAGTAGMTALNPTITLAGQTFIDVSWLPNPGSSYVTVLALDSGFTNIFSSQTVSFSSRTYVGLQSCTNYYFKVKISTESDASYAINIKSTQTMCGGTDFALQFSSAGVWQNQRVQVPHRYSYDFTSQVTLEFWMKRQSASTPTANQYLVSKDSPGKTTGWAVYLQSATARIRFEPLIILGGLTSNQTILDSNWHHVALTRDSSGNANLYIDGFLDSSNYTNTPYTNSDPLKFGNSEDSSDDFEGLMDEVRIWNSALPVGQIRCSRRLAMTGSESYLDGYWDFNDGVGQTVMDKAPIHNDGVRGFSSSIETEDPLWVASSIPAFGTACDVTPPTIHVQNPLNNSTATISGLATVYGTALDNQQVVEVHFTLRRMSDSYYWNRTGSYWSAAVFDNMANGTLNWSFPTTSSVWTPGTYELQAKAIDNDGNETIAISSFTVYADIEAVPPTVNFTSHVDSGTYTDSQLTYITGTAADNAALSHVKIKFVRLSDNFEWDGPNVVWMSPPRANNTFGAPDNWNYTMPVSAWTQTGDYIFTATAFDQAGNQASKSIFITVSNGAGSDNIYPTVQIQHPGPNSTHAPAALASVYGTSADNNGFVDLAVSIKDINLSLFWNGSSFSSGTEIFNYPPTSANWNYSGVPVGSWTSGHQYQLRARARDGANNTTFASVDFNVDSGSSGDTIAPYATIINPTEGTSYTPSTLSINGNAGDNIALSMVEVSVQKNSSGLYYDGSSFTSGAEVFLMTAGLGAWTFNLPSAALANGSYILKARAKDTSGNTALSATRTFSITGASSSGDGVAPTAAILVPANGGTYTSATAPNTINGTSNDNTAVTEARYSIKDDSNKYFNGSNWTSDSPVYRYVQITNNWFDSFPTAAWKNGTFIITGDFRDGANNITSVSNTFTMTGFSGGGSADNEKPQIFIYNPAQGASQGPNSFTYLNGRVTDAFGVGQVTLTLQKVGGNYFDGSSFNSATSITLYPSLTNATASGVDFNYSMLSYVYSDGTYLMTTKASDTSNNQETVVSCFTVTGAGGGDNTNPTGAITSFNNNDTKTSYEMVTIAGTANDDNSLDSVRIRITRNSDGKSWDGASWQTASFDMLAGGLASWSIGLPVSMWADGSYVVIARIRDTAGRETLISQNLTISGTGSGATPPTITIATLVAGQTYTPAELNTLSGASDGTSVRVRIKDKNLLKYWNATSAFWDNNISWITATVNAGNWTVNNGPSYWTNGQFEIMAEALKSGLVSTAQKDINVSASGASDFTPPAAINNLTAQPGTAVGSVVLAWTSPGDDANTGTATGYAIRFSPNPITTEAQWTSASDISVPPVSQTPPAPLVNGSNQTMTVNNLTPGVAYFFGIRAKDEAFNIAPFSNSPLATAFVGCVAGAGDGEGSVTLSHASIPANTDTTVTLVYTVGSHGITTGGKVSVRMPDGWANPQNYSNTMSGYAFATTSNAQASLSTNFNGQTVELTITGTLNQNDTITISYKARSYSCTGATSGLFVVTSQANSCGVLTEIASQPTLALTAGAASWLGFGSTYEKFVQVGNPAQVSIIGQDFCGNQASAASSISVLASVVVWNPNTYTYDNDTNARLSLASNMASSFMNSNVTFNSGTNELPLYYQFDVDDGRQRKVKIVYQAIGQSYNTENYLSIVPIAAGQGITSVSISKTTAAGSASSVTFDPAQETVYINYTTPANLSSQVEVKNGNGDVINTLWGYTPADGRPVQLTWNGYQTSPYGVAPSGNYYFVIKAAGQQNTSLSAVLQTVGVSGVVKTSLNAAISLVNINVYGPVYRYIQTAADGTYFIGGLTPGTYTIDFDKPGYARETASFTFNSSNIDRGTQVLKAYSKVIVNMTRANATSDLWGMIEAQNTAATSEMYSASVRFAYGRTTADNGMTNSKPELSLPAGKQFSINLRNMPGFTATPLVKTLSDGETYTWNVALTTKKGLSGRITIPNTFAAAGMTWIYISATKGSDTYPTKFASAQIPAGEYEGSYSLPDLDAGAYAVKFETPGLSPEIVNITMAGSDLTQNVALTTGGQATFNVTVQGDSTGLDSKGNGAIDGLFQIYMRYSNTQTNTYGFKTLSFNTNAVTTSIADTQTGLPNGSYQVFFDQVDGFSLNTASPQTLTIASGSGSLSSTFAQDSGILRANMTLPGGTVMGNLNFYLSKEGVYRNTPAISGTTAEFRNLASGRYHLSVYNTINSVSRYLDVQITNGKTTDVSINLGNVQTYTISGTVRTQAGPPYDSLTAIDAIADDTLYIDGMATPVPVLRVQAQLINPDGSVDALPTTAGSTLDPAKLKYSVVNTANGSYSIAGLESGKIYRVGVDIANLPRTDRMIAPVADMSGVDFTIQSGGKIQLTVTAPTSETNYALTLNLIDTLLKKTIQTSAIAINGTSATAEFSNLPTGSFLVTVTDPNSPVKYSAKALFVTLATNGETKTASLSLVESGRVQVTLANRYGTLITADNASQLLPETFKARVFSPTHSTDLALNSLTGKFEATILPGIDYSLLIAPVEAPKILKETDFNKTFLSMLLPVRIDRGGDIRDLGTVVLKAGDDVSLIVTDSNNNPLPNILVLAYQSLAKTIAPMSAFTNDQGKVTFNLSSKTRYYDFVANPVGNERAQTAYAEGSKTSIDITKSEQITNLSIALASLSGSITGQITSLGNLPLLAGYGDKAGQPGVSLIVTQRGVQKIYEFMSDPTGAFSLPLKPGTYTLEVIAQGHQPRRFTDLTVANIAIPMGTIELRSAGLVNLSGEIRNTDGSLPSTDDINELIAVNALKERYRGALKKVISGSVENVDSYIINGLSPNTLYNLIAVDKNGRVRKLKEGFETAQDAVLALTFNNVEPTLSANFIFKIPERNEISIRFLCNQKFWSTTADSDSDGTADSEEMGDFVSILRGNGTLAGVAFSDDRLGASYTYTLGTETGNDVAVRARFKTEKKNPKTGDNYVASGDFAQPLGILAQQTNPINPNTGGELSIPNASMNFPAGAFTGNVTDDVNMGISEADTLADVADSQSLGASGGRTGAAAIQLADKLGAKAYPAGMYKAIKALAAAEVNPFSSFYDIFLPAGVSHLFDRNYKPTLTLKYDEGADPTLINIYYYNEAQGVYTLENTDRRVDIVNRTISVSLTHASIFTVLASSASIIQGDSFGGTLDVFNFPNPFDLNQKSVTLQNPGSASASQTIEGTMIKISVPSGLNGSAEIKIYNIAGELVRTIHSTGLTAGTHNYIEWDGKNDHGEKVASGVYLGRLEIGGESKIFKMAVVK